MTKNPTVRNIAMYMTHTMFMWRMNVLLTSNGLISWSDSWAINWVREPPWDEVCSVRTLTGSLWIIVSRASVLRFILSFFMKTSWTTRCGQSGRSKRKTGVRMDARFFVFFQKLNLFFCNRCAHYMHFWLWMQEKISFFQILTIWYHQNWIFWRGFVPFGQEGSGWQCAPHGL